jgi:hypothetical protein
MLQKRRTRRVEEEYKRLGKEESTSKKREHYVEKLKEVEALGGIAIVECSIGK